MKTTNHMDHIGRRHQILTTFDETEVESMVSSRQFVVALAEAVLDACVTSIMESASVRARLAAIRAKLPTSIEEAVAKAVAAEILRGDPASPGAGNGPVRQE